MPSIVVTPKYNPFTFDELYRPLAETTKMQMALEDQYNAMEMEAAKLDYLQKSDPDAYAVVKNYEDTLRDLAGELASNGLTPQSRQGVYDMRKMYSSDVEPINKYIAWKDAQAKSRQAMRDKDSSYMWETPLEDVYYNTWRENPSITFKGASGETLSRDVAESVKYLQNKWTNDPTIEDLSKKYSALKGMFRETEEYGISKEELRKFLNSNASEEDKKKVLGVYYDLLNHAINQVAEKHGLNSWKNSAEVENWKKASLENGLWAALGKEGDQYLNAPNGGKSSSENGEELGPNYPDVIFENLIGPTDFEEILYKKSKDIFNNGIIKRDDAAGRALQNATPDAIVTNKSNSSLEEFKKIVDHEVRTHKVDEKNNALRHLYSPFNEPNPTIDKEVWGVRLQVSPLISLGYELEKNNMLPEKERVPEEQIIDKYIFSNDNTYTIETATTDIEQPFFSPKDIKIFNEQNKSLKDLSIQDFKIAETKLQKRIQELNTDTDAAFFSHARFNINHSDALYWLKNTVNTEGNKEGELEAVKYKYDKNQRDFKIENTGEKVNIASLKDEDIKSIIPYYSSRGVILKILTKDGTFNVKAHLSANVSSEIDKQYENIEEAKKLLDNATLNYLDASNDTDIKKWKKEMDVLNISIHDAYINIQRALSREFKHNKATETNYN